MKSLTPEFLDSLIKLIIGTTFCFTVLVMVSLSLYSVVFVTQPMTGMSPADKQFFLLLSDMSKYILGSLATLLAVKGKDALPQFIPPALSTPKDREEPNSAPIKPKEAQTAPTTVRQEPVLPIPEPVATGFGGKPAPPPAHQPEI